MPSHLSLEYPAELPALESLNDSIDSFAESQGWPAEFLFKVKLVLEEVVINVVSYGSEGGHVPTVQVKLSQDDGQLVIRIDDDGIAFDPLQKAPPDLDASLDDRPIGGLGVYLVRQLMDSVSYQRDGDWNRLTVSTSLPKTHTGD
jgi:anti-sigma regulatory factor (Ser/Thr protein kinase)